MQSQEERVRQLVKYFSGSEFRQRMTEIVEAFEGMQEDLAAERRLMMTQWKKREKNLEMVLSSAAGL